jgi:hypothetical protein
MDMDHDDIDIVLKGLSVLGLYSTNAELRLRANLITHKLCLQTTSLSISEAQHNVVGAARAWCNNVDNRDVDLLTVLRVAVRRLEAVEKMSSK